MKYPTILFLVFFSFGLLSAQNQPVSVSFNVLLWAPFDTLAPGQREPTPPDLYYVSGEEPIQVNGTWNVPTPEFKFAGRSPLVFGVPLKRGDGERSFKTIATVPLLESNSHLILIFFQNPEGEYRVFPIDVGLGEMPQGSLKLINYGGEKIFAKVGEQVQEMGQGQEWIISVQEAKNFQLRMQLASRQDEGFRLVYRSSFAVPEKNIRMVFLIHRANLDSGPWRVRPIAGFDTIDRSTEPVDTEAMIRDFREGD